MKSADSLCDLFHRSDTPPEVPLVTNAGVQSEAVFRSIFQTAHIGFADFCNGSHGINPGSLFRS